MPQPVSTPVPQAVGRSDLPSRYDPVSSLASPVSDLQGAHEMQAHLQRTFMSIRSNLESSMDAMMRKMEDTAVRIEDVERSLAEISSLTHLDDLPDLPPLPAP